MGTQALKLFSQLFFFSVEGNSLSYFLLGYWHCVS
jgi:hypothetical protein